MELKIKVESTDILARDCEASLLRERTPPSAAAGVLRAGPSAPFPLLAKQPLCSGDNSPEGRGP